MRDHGPRIRDSQRGTATIMALFLAVLVAAWVWAGLSVNLSRRALERKLGETANAVRLAENGITLAFGEIDAKTSPASFLQTTLGSGSVIVTIAEVEPGLYRVCSTGAVGGVERESNALIAKGTINGFMYGLFGHDELSLKNAWIDSYDGNLGSYADQVGMDLASIRTRPFTNHVNPNASIGSNRQVDLSNVAVQGNVLVSAGAAGDDLTLDAGGDGSGTDWSVNNLEISGTLSAMTDPFVLPPINRESIESLRETNDNPLAFRTDGGVVYMDVNDNPDPHGDRIQVMDGEEVVLPAGRYYLKDLKVLQGGRVTVTGKVEIWIENKLDLNGGNLVTASGKADDLRIFVGEFRRSSAVMARELETITSTSMTTGEPLESESTYPEYADDSDEAAQAQYQPVVPLIELSPTFFVTSEGTVATSDPVDADVLTSTAYEVKVPESAVDTRDDLWALKKGHVRFKHGGLFVGVLYVPTGKVRIDSQADACGSIIAQEIEVANGGAFHFDESLMATDTSVLQGTSILVRW